jgi:hypothetical protein
MVIGMELLRTLRKLRRKIRKRNIRRLVLRIEGNERSGKNDQRDSTYFALPKA